MTPAVATEIRGFMAGIEAIIVRELASATVPGVVIDPPIDPPTGVTDSDKVEWRKNGFSATADTLGLFRCKPVEDMQAGWPSWLTDEMQKRFICWQAFDGGKFLDDRARLNAHMNMGNRRTVPGASAGMGGDPFSLEACDYHLVLAPTATARDWNISPETQAKRNYVSEGIDVFVRYDAAGKPNGKAAGAHNFDESIGADFWLNLNRNHAREVCKVRGVDPAQFGL